MEGKNVIEIKRKFNFRIWRNRMLYKVRHPLKELKWQWHCSSCAVRRWWYCFRHSIHIGIDGSMLPDLGRGKYVDVLRKGNYIEIHDHSKKDNPFTIRLIPYQPNHGVMVEYVGSDGRCGWRTHMDSQMFLKVGMNTCEAHQ
jgi:hypothetical protein